MKKILSILLIGIVCFAVHAWASTVTALDANDLIVTDDAGISKTYTTNQISAWYNQVYQQDQQAQSAQVAANQRQQVADESVVEVGAIQQVFENEVATNSYNQATSI